MADNKKPLGLVESRRFFFALILAVCLRASPSPQPSPEGEGWGEGLCKS